MAAPTTKVYKTGRLTLTIYHFHQAGDELPEHVHDESSNHITFISRGSFRVTGEAAIAGGLLVIGEVIDWPVGQRHGFVALVDNARIVQVGK